MTWIGGIEALHSFTPPSASEPAITLGQLPYRLTGISGLSSLGESEANSDPIVGGIGERGRLSQRRSKTVAYEGRIIASSMLELRNAESALRTAFGDDSAEGRIDITAHPDNAELAGETPKFYEARALNCDIYDSQSTKSFTRSFVVGVRAGDPRVWDAEPQSVDLSISKTATAVAAVASANAAARAPVLTVGLPASALAQDVVVKNVTTGKSLTLNLPEGSKAATLTLDFSALSVTDGSGADKSALLDLEDLSLWNRGPLAAGDNEIEVTAWKIESAEWNPAKTVVVNDAGTGSVAWVNPANAETEDGKSATVALGKGTVSEWLKATVLGLAIPSTAVITGYELFVLGIGSHAQTVESALVVGGVVQPAIPAVRKFEGNSVAAIGDKRNRFGVAGVTAAVANAETFGVVVSMEGLAVGASASVGVLQFVAFYRSPTPAAYATKITMEWVGGHY
jgi:hypothetical protein